MQNQTLSVQVTDFLFLLIFFFMIFHGDIDYRVEYLEKSKQVQTQLQTLRSEIELLKIEENQCVLDIISAEQIRAGETKYSTLKKLKTGNTTKARVAFFEEL